MLDKSNTQKNKKITILTIVLLFIICLGVCLSFPVYPSFEKRTDNFNKISKKTITFNNSEFISNSDKYYIMSSRFRLADIVGYKITGDYLIENHLISCLIECLFDNDTLGTNEDKMMINDISVYKNKEYLSDKSIIVITFEFIYEADHYYLEWLYDCSDLSDTEISGLNRIIDEICISEVNDYTN